MADWAGFKNDAVSSEAVQTTYKKTKSFADIPLKTIFKILDARILETTFGPRLVLSIKVAQPGEESEERFAFPRLAFHFTNKNGDDLALKAKCHWPRYIGFDSVNPYKFFYKCD